MSNPCRCLLTTRDFSILVALLERDGHADEAFLRLLRRKLSGATVVFRDDIAPQVAMIDGHVEFTVDGHLTDSRILVQGEEGPFPGPSLPITTLRGLALLGLATGETIRVERSDGGSEELRLDRVSRQPEAILKEKPRPPASEGKSSVVAFKARRRTASARPMAYLIGPDDDDPGPRSA